MYSKHQREKTLQLYDQCKSVTKVVQQLLYSTRKRLYDWIAERNHPPKSKPPRQRFINTPEHPRHPPLSLKLDTIHRCFELGESKQLVSGEIGYSRASIYTWRKKYILKGAVALMNNNDDPQGKLSEGVQSVAMMLKAIHAQESKEAAKEKAVQVAEKLKEMKLSATAKKLQDGIEETLTYMDFPPQHWSRIRTNNTIERLNREIKRRTKPIGVFPDGQSALMLVYARLRHVAGTQWGVKRYMNMEHLRNMRLESNDIAG